jgi:hypothetical protein
MEEYQVQVMERKFVIGFKFRDTCRVRCSADCEAAQRAQGSDGWWQQC